MYEREGDEAQDAHTGRNPEGGQPAVAVCNLAADVGGGHYREGVAEGNGAHGAGGLSGGKVPGEEDGEGNPGAGGNAGDEAGTDHEPGIWREDETDAGEGRGDEAEGEEGFSAAESI